MSQDACSKVYELFEAECLAGLDDKALEDMGPKGIMALYAAWWSRQTDPAVLRLMDMPTTT